jgi:hypothetical protein
MRDRKLLVTDGVVTLLKYFTVPDAGITGFGKPVIDGRNE